MIEFNKNDTSISSYFFRYLLWFIVLIVISVLLGFNNQKQLINSNFKINNLLSFGVIICKNTLVFIYVLTSIFIGKLNIYIMIITNAIRIGFLISKFKYPIYMLMILPHGIPEFFVFILLSEYVTRFIEAESSDIKCLLKISLLLYIILISSAIIEAWLTPYLVIKFC